MKRKSLTASTRASCTARFVLFTIFQDEATVNSLQLHEYRCTPRQITLPLREQFLSPHLTQHGEDSLRSIFSFKVFFEIEGIPLAKMVQCGDSFFRMNRSRSPLAGSWPITAVRYCAEVPDETARIA